MDYGTKKIIKRHQKIRKMAKREMEANGTYQRGPMTYEFAREFTKTMSKIIKKEKI